MKKVLIPILLIVVGLIIAVIPILISTDTINFDGEKIAVENIFNEEFSSIDINDSIYDIQIIKGEVNKIECNDYTHIYHEFFILNGRLKINLINTKILPFNYINFRIPNHEYKMIITLNKNEIDSLLINTSSGNVDIDFDQKIDNMNINSSSGKIKVKNTNGSILKATSSSGNINLISLSNYSIKNTSTSGNIKFENSTISSLELETTSGNINLQNTDIFNNLIINTTSGNIDFNNSDSNTMKILTTSGNVKGTIKTIKNFILTTTSGSTYISNTSPTANNCEINTTSGDIHIQVLS